MRGQRQLEPEHYTDKMRKALDVILDDCDPETPSSRKAANQLYAELKNLMPLATAKAIGKEAVWMGRNVYGFTDQKTGSLRDRVIRSAVSVPMSRDRHGKFSALDE